MNPSNLQQKPHQCTLDPPKNRTPSIESWHFPETREKSCRQGWKTLAIGSRIGILAPELREVRSPKRHFATPELRPKASAARTGLLMLARNEWDGTYTAITTTSTRLALRLDTLVRQGSKRQGCDANPERFECTMRRVSTSGLRSFRQEGQIHCVDPRMSRLVQ
jgi:hypothetical protein